MNSPIIGAVEPYGTQRHLTQSDIAYIESLKSEKRRAEVASWRELLRSSTSLESDILYHPSGAPYIEGLNNHISVSHCDTEVAVMLSNRVCAIDIESLSRDFERVASRYVSAAESKLICSDAPLLPLIWSAKETLYKLSPLDELDLLKDLKITKIDNGIIRGTARGCNREVTMRYEIRDSTIIVYTIL